LTVDVTVTVATAMVAETGALQMPLPTEQMRPLGKFKVDDASAALDVEHASLVTAVQYDERG